MHVNLDALIKLLDAATSHSQREYAVVQIASLHSTKQVSTEEILKKIVPFILKSNIEIRFSVFQLLKTVLSSTAYSLSPNSVGACPEALREQSELLLSELESQPLLLECSDDRYDAQPVDLNSQKKNLKKRLGMTEDFARTNLFDEDDLIAGMGSVKEEHGSDARANPKGKKHTPDFLAEPELFADDDCLEGNVDGRNASEQRLLSQEGAGADEESLKEREDYVVSLIETAKTNLFDGTWYVRHGSALALDALCCSKILNSSHDVCTKEPFSSYFALLSCVLLRVLYLERYTDYVEECASSPVQQSAAKALAGLMTVLAPEDRAHVLNTISSFLKAKAWHVKAASLAFLHALHDETKLLTAVFYKRNSPLLCRLTCDDDDDVKRPAALFISRMAACDVEIQNVPKLISKVSSLLSSEDPCAGVMLHLLHSFYSRGERGHDIQRQIETAFSLCFSEGALNLEYALDYLLEINLESYAERLARVLFQVFLFSEQEVPERADCLWSRIPKKELANVCVKHFIPVVFHPLQSHFNKSSFVCLENAKSTMNLFFERSGTYLIGRNTLLAVRARTLRRLKNVCIPVKEIVSRIDEGETSILVSLLLGMIVDATTTLRKEAGYELCDSEESSSAKKEILAGVDSMLKLSSIAGKTFLLLQKQFPSLVNEVSLLDAAAGRELCYEEVAKRLPNFDEMHIESFPEKKRNILSHAINEFRDACLKFRNLVCLRDVLSKGVPNAYFTYENNRELLLLVSEYCIRRCSWSLILEVLFTVPDMPVEVVFGVFSKRVAEVFAQKEKNDDEGRLLNPREEAPRDDDIDSGSFSESEEMVLAEDCVVSGQSTGEEEHDRKSSSVSNNDAVLSFHKKIQEELMSKSYYKNFEALSFYLLQLPADVLETYDLLYEALSREFVDTARSFTETLHPENREESSVRQSDNPASAQKQSKAKRSESQKETEQVSSPEQPIVSLIKCLSELGRSVIFIEKLALTLFDCVEESAEYLPAFIRFCETCEPFWPYLPLFTVRVVRTLSDSVYGQAAASCLSLCVRLAELEYSGYRDANLEKRVCDQRTLLKQLFNPQLLEEFDVRIPIHITLRPYQVRGVNWLAFLAKYNLNGILCDDMGLGKTSMTLAVVLSAHAAASNKRSLIVAPASVVGHWVSEAQRVFSAKTLHALYGKNGVTYYDGMSKLQIDLDANKENETDYSVVVTSYETLRRSPELCEMDWLYVVLDEGHLIRNSSTATAKCVKSLRAKHKLILTGTPIQNSVVELHSLFDFLMPGYLGTEREFKAMYSVSEKDDPKAYGKRLEQLHKQLLPFMLRRMKEEVLNDLPPKTIQDCHCELSDAQRQFYSFANVEGRERSGIFKELRYMQRACTHPLLVFDNQDERHLSVLSAFPNCLEEVGPKLALLTELLKSAVLGASSRNKALVFVQNVASIALIERFVFVDELKDVGRSVLDASQGPTQRFETVRSFNEGECSVLIMTTHVGGLGLNLTSASTVIFLEHDWNPMKDLQAMDRAHRLGQKNSVNVYRLIARDTIEERIMGAQRFKLHVASNVVTQQNSSLETMDTEQILDVLCSKKRKE